MYPAVQPKQNWPPGPPYHYVSWQKDCWDELHPGPPYKSGGPLFIREVHCLNEIETVTGMLSEIQNEDGTGFVHPRKYSGILYLDLRGLGYSPDLALSNLSERVASRGTEAYKKFKPLKPACDLGQFWVELRDLRSMFSTRARSFKDLGSQYLNYQFGWVPFLSDVVKFIKLMRNLEDRLAFLFKNNNKWIRRHGVLTDAVGETLIINNIGDLMRPTLTTEFYSNNAHTKASYYEYSHNKVWFEGKFKYYIPALDTPSAWTMWDSAKLLSLLTGLRLTPSLLWELTPWSWLVDWFGNIGDILSNLDTYLFDDCVAKYAYVMETRSKTIGYVQQQGFKRHGLVTLKSQITTETKERANASPWDLSVEASFTPRMAAILTALGLSRRKRF